MIKKRKMKLSKRGLYIQDAELMDTSFRVGSHYRYIVDLNTNKVIIVTSNNESDNTVSKRKIKEGLKPVIDIRNKQALQAFEGCEYLQITIISDEKIIIEGFKETEPSALTKAKGFFKKTVNKVKKLIDITDILKVRKTAEIVMSLKEFKQAVGYEQITFDLAGLAGEASELRHTREFKTKLKYLDIPFKVVSLFSGAGLLDKGFLDTKVDSMTNQNFYDIVFAIDNNDGACKTYATNIGEHIVNADITTIDKSKIPASTVVIGGSPCQGFSNSNRKTNFVDNPKNLLVRQFIEVVKANKDCQVFVLENVPQILTAGNGQFKREICQALSEFEIESGVLSSLAFGSSQDRQRAIFIGSKIGKIELPKPNIYKVKTVRKAFEGLHDDLPNQRDISEHKDLTLERIRHVKPGSNVFDIPKEIRPKGTHSDFYRRLEWDKPSITIVNPRKSMLLHPSEDRMLSVRECARIMGLPDDFIFLGKLNERQQQVANGVPLELGRTLAETVKNALLEKLKLNKSSNLAISV